MSPALRPILDRPLGEHDRQRAFALAAIVLLAAAAALTLTAGTPDPARRDPTATAPLAPPATPAPVLTTAVPPTPAPAVVPRRAKRRPAPSWVARTARRFLPGYLRYLYGRGSARQIAGASGQLRRQLAAERLRVPPAARRRRPRTVSLHVRRMPDMARAWMVTAGVDDGDVAVYPVQLLVVRRAGRPVVTRIGGER